MKAGIGVKATNQNPPPVEIDSDKYSTLDNYKNLSQIGKESSGNNHNNRNKNKGSQCVYKCGTCELLSNELIQEKYNNFKNILLEDDSKLIFHPLF